jgi:hypothetical protein
LPHFPEAHLLHVLNERGEKEGLLSERADQNYDLIQLAKEYSVVSGRAGPNTLLYLERLAKSILLPGSAG